MSKQIIEIAVEVKRTSEKAYLVTDGIVEVWIPRSQIRGEEESKGVITSISIPEWLAKDKGLI